MTAIAPAHEAPHNFEAPKPVSRVASRRRAATPTRLAPDNEAPDNFEAPTPVSRVASRRRAATPIRLAPAPATNLPRSLRAAFTLLEMLAVIFLMSIVLFVAIDFYLDLSRASNDASAGTRSARRAVVLLDRVARDLEGAVMLQKPAEMDPIAFPWLFLAESETSDGGADRVKFVRRGHHPAASDAIESDLEMVSWIVAPDESGEGELELRRWSGPQGESLDRSFPDVEHSDLVAAGIASFGIKFQGEEGEWTGRWDSSELTESSELPIAAEIEIAFRTGPNEDDVDGPYTRRVLLPLRPIDLQDQLAAAEGEGGVNGLPGDEDSDGIPDAEDEVDNDGDDGPGPPATEEDQADEDGGGGKTVQQCLLAHPEIQAQVDAFTKGNPQAAAIVNGMLGLPASAVPPNPFISPPADCM